MGEGSDQRETLTIVVPAYDEERRLPALLAALADEADDVAARAGLRLAEVIVVDDGSSDRTRELLDAYAGLRAASPSSAWARTRARAPRSRPAWRPRSAT